MTCYIVITFLYSVVRFEIMYGTCFVTKKWSQLLFSLITLIFYYFYITFMVLTHTLESQLIISIL